MAVKEQVSAGARASTRTADSRGGFPWGNVGRYTAVVLVVFIALAPLYWSVATAVKSGLELNASPPTLFPHSSAICRLIWRKQLEWMGPRGCVLCGLLLCHSPHLASSRQLF